MYQPLHAQIEIEIWESSRNDGSCDIDKGKAHKETFLENIEKSYEVQYHAVRGAKSNTPFLGAEFDTILETNPTKSKDPIGKCSRCRSCTQKRGGKYLE